MRLIVAVAVLAFVGVVAARNWEDVQDYTWEQYKVDFKKVFLNSQAERVHRITFYHNLERIRKHNSEEQSYKMGINQFTDNSQDELKAYMGYDHTMALKMRESQVSEVYQHGVALGDLPESVDWRMKGIITPVKNQGGCGSCWAFGSTESIESYVAINTGALLVMSPQFFVDCAPNPNDCGGTGGCGGSIPELAFNYTAMSGGQTLESLYPYTGQDGTCNSGVKRVATVTGYVKLPSNNYTAIMGAVATVGPLAINVAAMPWQLYSSGVFTGCPQPPQDVDIDHVVQLVGYGTDSVGGDYWLVRNSWGTGWGEAGYIRVQRMSSNMQFCSSDSEPSDGTGCTGGPSQVNVCGSCGLWYDVSYPTGASLVN
jgi:cathepsin L